MAIPSQNTRSGVDFGFHLAPPAEGASGGEVLSVSWQLSVGAIRPGVQPLATSDLL